MDAVRDPTFPQNDAADARLALDIDAARRSKPLRTEGRRVNPAASPARSGKRPRPTSGGKSIRAPCLRLYERDNSLIKKEKLRKLLLRGGWRWSSSDAKEELYRTVEKIGFALFDMCYECLRHEMRMENERRARENERRARENPPRPPLSRRKCGPITSDVLKIASEILMKGLPFEPQFYDMENP